MNRDFAEDSKISFVLRPYERIYTFYLWMVQGYLIGLWILNYNHMLIENLKTRCPSSLAAVNFLWLLQKFCTHIGRYPIALQKGSQSTHQNNEMVSLGDTAISLHILQPPLWGGAFWVRSDLDSGKKIRVFNFRGGVFWERSDLDSEKNFILGGGCVLGKVGLGLWEEFHF